MPRSALARAFSRHEVGRLQQPKVWLLLGGRAGDNNQALALADALGWPAEAKRLSYNQLRRVPWRSSGVGTVSKSMRSAISPPWPDLVICVGYASVPVARHIRECSSGRTKLVHIGNPRENLRDFNLQITTPQYPRDAANLLELSFPIGNPARNAQPTIEELRWLDDFPHPRRLIAVGGPARHWALDKRQLQSAIRMLGARRGSLIVATSARTPERMKRALRTLVSGPNQTVVDVFPSFATLLSRCQEIYVTADSVSMLSEAVLSGRPVGMIPIRRSFFGRISQWLWERPLDRATVPDLRRYWRLLKERGLIGTVELPVPAQVCDTVAEAADAVRQLFAVGNVVDEEKG